jgi:acetyl esterase
MRANILQDVEYTRAAGQSLRLDASIPAGPGPHPAVLIVHGGGWIAGHRRHNVEPLFRPLENAGFAWFSISYRLATEISLFGLAIDDVADAIDFVRSHASEYRIDPNRVAIVGDSAGAHLAMMAVLRAGASSPVAAFVGIGMPADLEMLASDSPSIPAGIRNAVASSPWADMLGGVIRELSPVNHVHTDMPATLLIHGTGDRIVPFEQAERFCAAARSVHARCEVHPVRGEGHGIRWWQDTRWTKSMIEWLDARLAQAPVSAAS